MDSERGPEPPNATFFVVDERDGSLWSVPKTSVLWRDHPMPIPWESWKKHVADAAVDRHAFVTAEMLICLGTELDPNTFQTSPLAVVATSNGGVAYMQSFQMPITTYVGSGADDMNERIAFSGASFLWPCAYSHTERVQYKLQRAASLVSAVAQHQATAERARRMLALGDAVCRPEVDGWVSGRRRPAPSILLDAARVTDVTALSPADRFAWLHSPVAPFLFRENRAQCEQSHRAAIEEKVKDPWRAAYTAQHSDRRALRDAQLENLQVERIHDNPGAVTRLRAAVTNGLKTMKRVAGSAAENDRVCSSFSFPTLPFELQRMIVGLAMDDAFRTADIHASAESIHILRTTSVGIRTLVDDYATTELYGIATSLHKFIDTGHTTLHVDDAVRTGRLSTMTYARFSCSATTLWLAAFDRPANVPIVQKYIRERERVAVAAKTRATDAAVPNQHIAVIEARARRPVERMLRSRVREVMEMADSRGGGCATDEGGGRRMRRRAA